METETKTEAARGEGVAFAGHIKRESQQNPQTEMVDDRLRALHAAVEEEEEEQQGKGKRVYWRAWALGHLECCCGLPGAARHCI